MRELRRLEVPCAQDGMASNPTSLQPVYACVDGALAVHRGVGLFDSDSWVITHVPTGRKLPLEYHEEHEALVALDTLLRAGEWDVANYDTIRSNKELRAAVLALAAKR